MGFYRGGRDPLFILSLLKISCFYFACFSSLKECLTSKPYDLGIDINCFVIGNQFVTNEGGLKSHNLAKFYQ